MNLKAEWNVVLLGDFDVITVSIYRKELTRLFWQHHGSSEVMITLAGLENCQQPGSRTIKRVGRRPKPEGYQTQCGASVNIFRVPVKVFPVYHIGYSYEIPSDV